MKKGDKSHSGGDLRSAGCTFFICHHRHPYDLSLKSLSSSSLWSLPSKLKIVIKITIHGLPITNLTTPMESVRIVGHIDDIGRLPGLIIIMTSLLGWSMIIDQRGDGLWLDSKLRKVCLWCKILDIFFYLGKLLREGGSPKPLVISGNEKSSILRRVMPVEFCQICSGLYLWKCRLQTHYNTSAFP